VLLTLPGAVLPAYSALFMDSMATFLRNYYIKTTAVFFMIAVYYLTRIV
jgi:hypothetical protein